MNYKNKQLELKVLKRKLRREVRENVPVMILGSIMGASMALIFFNFYI
jgi:hypothetical protein